MTIPELLAELRNAMAAYRTSHVAHDASFESDEHRLAMKSIADEALERQRATFLAICATTARNLDDYHRKIDALAEVVNAGLHFDLMPEFNASCARDRAALGMPPTRSYRRKPWPRERERERQKQKGNGSRR